MEEKKTVNSKANQKYQEIKWKIQYNSRKAIDWVKENPDTCIVIAAVAVATIKGGMKVCDRIERKVRLDKLQDLKDRYIYDRSLGTYLRLDRIPTANEYLEIEERKRNGETLTQILRSMRLI